MSRQKRLLKKEKVKIRIKLIFAVLAVLIITAIGLEFLYFNFVKVSIISPLARGKLSKLANLENELTQKKIPFANVIAGSNDSYTVNLLDGGEVILSSKKEIGSQLSSLQLMLSKLTIEGKKLKVLDFRFDNPVVTF